MGIISKTRKGITNFRKNVILGSQTTRLLLRNQKRLKIGDSLVAVKTRRLVRESTIPKPIKKRMDASLTKLIHNHLRSGRSWVEFREQLSLKEKKENRKLSEKEIEDLWHQWNKDQDGY